MERYFGHPIHPPADTLARTVYAFLRNKCELRLKYFKYPVYCLNGTFGVDGKVFERRIDFVAWATGGTSKEDGVVIGELKTRVGTDTITKVFKNHDLDASAFHQVVLYAWLFEQNTALKVGHVMVVYASREGECRG